MGASEPETTSGLNQSINQSLHSLTMHNGQATTSTVQCIAPGDDMASPMKSMPKLTFTKSQNGGRNNDDFDAEIHVDKVVRVQVTRGVDL